MFIKFSMNKNKIINYPLMGQAESAPHSPPPMTIRRFGSQSLTFSNTFLEYYNSGSQHSLTKLAELPKLSERKLHYETEFATSPRVEVQRRQIVFSKRRLLSEQEIQSERKCHITKHS